MADKITDENTTQRNLGDRRAFGWRTVMFGFLRSRRRDLRRTADADIVFLDWHHPWLFVLSVGTMLLSCADAFLTLQLIERGMIEANPLMAVILERSTAAFAATKMGLTGFGILTLVFLAKLKFLDRVRTGLFLTLFFAAYATLVCYELVSLMRLL